MLETVLIEMCNCRIVRLAEANVALGNVYMAMKHRVIKVLFLAYSRTVDRSCPIVLGLVIL